MTAPWRDDEDDDPENDALIGAQRPLRSYRSRDVLGQKDEDLAPLRMDVSIAVILGACVGSIAASVASEWPDLRFVTNAAGIALVLLLIRWTKKR